VVRILSKTKIVTADLTFKNNSSRPGICEESKVVWRHNELAGDILSLCERML